MSKKLQDQLLETTLRNFFAKYPVLKFPPKTSLMRSDVPLLHVFYVVKGSVKMSTTSKDGRVLALHVYHPGACFPLLSLLDHVSQSFEFSSLGAVECIQVPIAEFREFLQSDALVSYHFLIRMLAGLNGILFRTQQAALVSAYHQVAGMLLYFWRHFGNSKNEIELKLTHQEIAEWLGLTRENVSIQMKQLEKQGLVRRKRGGLQLCDIEEIKKLVADHDLFFDQ